MSRRSFLATRALARVPLWRTARVWERSLDAVLVVALVVEVARWVNGDGNGAETVLAFLGGGVAAFRRRAPTAVMVVLIVLSGIGALAEPTNLVGLWVAAQVGLFSLALRGDRRVALAAASVLAATLYVIVILSEGLPWLDPTSLVVIVWSAAVVGAALTIRAQHDAVRAEEQRAESVRAAQDSVVARRLTEERVRIARDLHDSVAHGISAIALQTSAIDAALGDPVEARERLRVVRSTARQVLDETQQVLRLLRAGEESTADADLATVVADARAAGDVVDASVDSALHGEDELVRISLAQILREALTNARRHGHGAVSVRLHVGDSATELVVVNGLPPRPQPTPSPGLGIRGMRERAEALHGDVLVHRTTSDFTLTVRIPRTAEAEEA